MTTPPPTLETPPEPAETPVAPAGKRRYNLPPGLKHSLPFYAFKPWVKLGDPIRLFDYLHKTYGNISHYKFLGTPIVFINDPDYIKEVLVTQAAHFVKERTVKRMKVLLGEGLITSDNPIHIRQRRIAAPAFHRQRIAAYADQIVAIAAHQSTTWRAGETIDIAAASMELSLEIVARTLFDTEVDADIRRINDEVNTVMGLYNFLIAFPQIELFMKLPIPGIMKFRRSKGRLDAVVDRLVATRRAEMAAGAPGEYIEKGDLLHMLLTSVDEQADAQGQYTGMSPAQIRDEVLTIFLAGYETVANALTWTWYLLSQHPDVEARMHAEVDAVLEGKLATLADYPNLRYTEQVFAESMRLYPPAWAMGRMSTKAIQLGPYTIPPGAHVFFSQYMMGRSSEYFPDPLTFDPDRFTPEAKAARAKYTYFPFGGGSRQCIGEAFAWMEGTLSLATLAQRWRPRFVPTYPIELQPKITLRPKNPVMMTLEPRNLSGTI
ncbi:cytochrome P450 [Granulicella arctica]|uniref:cytochrome P450 n=1 Tax=Granulicella arctica TaxID=940613 RepID=UPI0021E0ADF9|nr:cytochrome P450 [Granulicella arctica]